MADSSTSTDDSQKLSGSTVKYMAKRVLSEFMKDQGTDQAAKLTYFMVLSIAPTLLAMFSLATLLLADLKDQIADMLVDLVNSAAGGSGLGADDAIRDTVNSLMGSATGGTIALIIGIATALWSASAYIKAYGRVANLIYEIPEGRGAIKMNGTMLLLTLAMILGMLAIMISLLLSQTIVEGLLGPIASTIGATGLLEFLTESFLPIWTWAKWPVILVLAFALISLLYWGAPNIEKPYRFISPGGVFAILGVIIAAVALSIYMATVAGYSSYGAIGGVMAVLFALWVMNIVIVIGTEVDAEFERAQELESGRPAEKSLTLPLREDAAAIKADEKHEQIVDEGRDIRLRNLHHDREAYTGEDSRLSPQREPGIDTGTASDQNAAPESAEDSSQGSADRSRDA
ncbi:YihY/virulence factor BrkB family protein [Brachybacterium sp. UMB0905]|uniref:YihY/virulence factor BrkB family protein n=1 Tax=Brachybacterium sp. UMB0905 TaxID=2069310 RepID=UPI000C8070D9|nr:YihY/virulence factor BrkB family protein [Brachybacterium sp. UMB0905]PMC76557.1 hypothetical protein CJ197_02045 [Brachybacterium sp. UMB0905]